MTVNTLFPIFLKLSGRRVLIVGGGKVALEKITTLLNNSPDVEITVVAISIDQNIRKIASHQPNVEVFEKKYENTDLDRADLVISCVNDFETSKQISVDARAKGIWVNAADKPEWCDFYLGSVVRKGNLKIAISTNGKSPTVAKRLKEILSGALPEEIDEVLQNLERIRNSLRGNLDQKVKKLNDITKDLTF